MKKIKQETIGGRAEAGVVTVGLNGETYKGGQFLPSTDQAKLYRKAEAKKRSYLSKKQEIEKFVWSVPPADNVRSLYGVLKHYFDANVWWSTKKYKLLSFERLVAMYDINDYQYKHLESLFKKFYNGDRWVEIVEWEKFYLVKK